MIQRCYNPKTQYFHLYGGRGIRVCARWKNSFANFLADMGPRPSKAHSVDRINSDGNYTPENTRWSTAKVQTANRRTPKDTVYVLHEGKRWELAKLARHLGLNYLTLYMRVYRGTIARVE